MFPASLIIDLLNVHRSPKELLSTFTDFITNNPNILITNQQDCKEIIETIRFLTEKISLEGKTGGRPTKQKENQQDTPINFNETDKKTRKGYQSPKFFANSSSFGNCKCCGANLEKGSPKFVHKTSSKEWVLYCPMRQCLPGSNEEKDALWEEAKAWSLKLDK